MSRQYNSRHEAGGVGVIHRYSSMAHHHHPHGSNGNNNNNNSNINNNNNNINNVLSPISPLSPHQAAWSSSQSSGSPPTASTYTSMESSCSTKIVVGSSAIAGPNSNSEQQDYRLALREIENRLLLDDDEDEELYSSPSPNTTTLQLLMQQESQEQQAPSSPYALISAESGLSTKELIDRMADPEKLLLLCAESVSNSNYSLADLVIARLSQVVSIYGTPMQRLAAYMVEGLSARMQSSGFNLCRALRCKEPVGNEILSAMQVMYEVCPYIKFGYMAANGAIAEALKDEPVVHIIDFEIAQGTQYISLIQALALRPNGPPLVRITGVGDPTADVAAPGGVHVVGQRLAKLAQSVNVPFEFHAVPVNAAAVTPGMLQRRAGEALAVNFAMQLHHMPDESVSVSNPRDSLLRMARSLCPKIVTLVEQEANTNTAPFMARFRESLDYYYAVFESLDVTLPRESKERVSVEQHCLARDLVNLIACEGPDRVERHEVMGKWAARMRMAGFKEYPLSRYVNHTIKCLLRTYCDKYKLTEDNGVIYLGWLDRSLVSASAWH